MARPSPDTRRRERGSPVKPKPRPRPAPPAPRKKPSLGPDRVSEYFFVSYKKHDDDDLEDDDDVGFEVIEEGDPENYYDWTPHQVRFVVWYHVMTKLEFSSIAIAYNATYPQAEGDEGNNSPPMDERNVRHIVEMVEMRFPLLKDAMAERGFWPRPTEWGWAPCDHGMCCDTLHRMMPARPCIMRPAAGRTRKLLNLAELACGLWKGPYTELRLCPRDHSMDDEDHDPTSNKENKTPSASPDKKSTRGKANPPPPPPAGRTSPAKSSLTSQSSSNRGPSPAKSALRSQSSSNRGAQQGSRNQGSGNSGNRGNSTVLPSIEFSPGANPGVQSATSGPRASSARPLSSGPIYRDTASSARTTSSARIKRESSSSARTRLDEIKEQSKSSSMSVIDGRDLPGLLAQRGTGSDPSSGSGSSSSSGSDSGSGSNSDGSSSSSGSGPGSGSGRSSDSSSWSGSIPGSESSSGSNSSGSRSGSGSSGGVSSDSAHTSSSDHENSVHRPDRSPSKSRSTKINTAWIREPNLSARRRSISPENTVAPVLRNTARTLFHVTMGETGARVFLIVNAGLIGIYWYFVFLPYFQLLPQHVDEIPPLVCERPLRHYFELFCFLLGAHNASSIPHHAMRWILLRSWGIHVEPTHPALTQG